MIYQTNYQSPIGQLVLASDGTNLVGLWMEGQKYFGGSVKEEMVPKADLPIFEQAKSWLDSYFAGKKPEITELPLAPMGSDFRQEVWKMLCEIPYGEVTTYGALARKLAASRTGESEQSAAADERSASMRQPGVSAQAVGGAVGHNPISIIIPCHRVVGADGSLTGYAGGLDKKVRLLELEKVDITSLRSHVTVLKR